MDANFALRNLKVLIINASNEFSEKESTLFWVTVKVAQIGNKAYLMVASTDLTFRHIGFYDSIGYGRHGTMYQVEKTGPGTSPRRPSVKNNGTRVLTPSSRRSEETGPGI